MGKLINGIKGPIQGKVGSVIGSSRNGVHYIKGPYKNRTKKVSKKEMANREKFAAAQKWLSPIIGFVRDGFKGYSERSQGFVSAKSLLLKNAFADNGSGLRIDPSLVQVSYGDLPLPENLAVKLTENSELEFTWDPGEQMRDGAPSDQIMMLAYDVQKMEEKMNTTGQFRSTGKDILSLKAVEGKIFQVYAAFCAADRSRQSNSVYLGEWKV
jgi:hypothetical protein